MINDPIIQANKALLEGDRAEVLTCLQGVPNSPEVTWLRAHAAETDKERLSLLEQVVLTNHQVYAPIAQRILDHERQAEIELLLPPDYQFWKQPTWRARFERLKQQRMWIIGMTLSLIMTVMLFAALAAQNRQVQQLAVLALTQTAQTAAANPTAQIKPVFTPTVTALPESLQPQVNYPAGQFRFLRWELPTNRPVTMGGYEQKLATPAAGSKFVAIQYKFICRKALCDTPPEAEISLRLTDGQEIRYQNSDQPALVEAAGVQRVAQNQEVYGWLVFEVPDRAIPLALLLRTGERENDPVLELPWPKQ